MGRHLGALAPGRRSRPQGRCVHQQDEGQPQHIGQEIAPQLGAGPLGHVGGQVQAAQVAQAAAQAGIAPVIVKDGGVQRVEQHPDQAGQHLAGQRFRMLAQHLAGQFLVGLIAPCGRGLGLQGALGLGAQLGPGLVQAKPLLAGHDGRGLIVQQQQGLQMRELGAARDQIIACLPSPHHQQPGQKQGQQQHGQGPAAPALPPGLPNQQQHERPEQIVGDGAHQGGQGQEQAEEPGPAWPGRWQPAQAQPGPQRGQQQGGEEYLGLQHLAEKKAVGVQGGQGGGPEGAGLAPKLDCYTISEYYNQQRQDYLPQEGREVAVVENSIAQGQEYAVAGGAQGLGAVGLLGALGEASQGQQGLGPLAIDQAVGGDGPLGVGGVDQAQAEQAGGQGQEQDYHQRPVLHGAQQLSFPWGEAVSRQSISSRASGAKSRPAAPRSGRRRARVGVQSQPWWGAV